MSAQDTAAIAVAATTVIGSFIGSVRWLVKHYLAELKPNGGAGANYGGGGGAGCQSGTGGAGGNGVIYLYY